MIVRYVTHGFHNVGNLPARSASVVSTVESTPLRSLIRRADDQRSAAIGGGAANHLTRSGLLDLRQRHPTEHKYARSIQATGARDVGRQFIFESAKRPVIQFADLALVTAWSQAHSLPMTVQLDFGTEEEEYEEVLALA